jgi:phospholipid/cholesterol/gamma-HCH transport system substrate-binding protein
MKLTREVKIGAVGLITITLIFFIFNYLKGKNLFSSTRNFYSIYNEVNGLSASKGVFLNGFQVGRVDEIFFHPSNDGRLIVKISLDKDFEFTNQTKMQIYEDGLIKGSAIRLLISEKGKMAQSGDTLHGDVAPTIADIVSKEITPLKNQINKVVSGLDKTLIATQKILDEENRQNIKLILKNINSLILTIQLTSSSVTQSSNSVNELILSNTKQINALLENTNNLVQTTEKTVGNINTKVEKLDVEKSINSLNASLEQMQSILTKINSTQGSMGKFINDPQLYDNLTKTSLNLQELIVDLKANPSRYIHISVFGKKQKQ